MAREKYNPQPLTPERIGEIGEALGRPFAVVDASHSFHYETELPNGDTFRISQSKPHKSMRNAIEVLRPLNFNEVACFLLKGHVDNITSFTEDPGNSVLFFRRSKEGTRLLEVRLDGRATITDRRRG